MAPITIIDIVLDDSHALMDLVDKESGRSIRPMPKHESKTPITASMS